MFSAPLMLSSITFISKKTTATGIEPTTRHNMLSFIWKGIYELLGGSRGNLLDFSVILYLVR